MFPELDHLGDVDQLELAEIHSDLPIFWLTIIVLALDQNPSTKASMSSIFTTKPRVVFVLGGPGSGKGTQCELILQHFSFVHLSVGELLRQEVETGSDLGTKIRQELREGKLVPSEISVSILLNAFSRSSTKRFLVDGFPRNDEQRALFEQITGFKPDFVLYFDAPQEELYTRLKNRGRQDDNDEAIKNRLQVYRTETLPVVDYYEDKGLLRRINAARDITRVFESTRNLFSPYIQDELLEVSEQLLKGIDIGDYATYESLCDEDLTCFEPEAQGQLVEKLPFHKFYFDIRGAGHVEERRSTIAAPRVMMLSEDAAVVTYTRLMQEPGIPLIGFSDAYNETRVWKRLKISPGKWQWKHVHFHRSKAPTQTGHTCVAKQLT